MKVKKYFGTRNYVDEIQKQNNVPTMKRKIMGENIETCVER